MCKVYCEPRLGIREVWLLGVFYFTAYALTVVNSLTKQILLHCLKDCLPQSTGLGCTISVALCLMDTVFQIVCGHVSTVAWAYKSTLRHSM